MKNKTMKRVGLLVAGFILGAFSLSSLDSIANTKKGSFVDPQNGERYEYNLLQRNNSRHLFIWSEKSHPLFASRIRDFDGNGSVDHVGNWTYPRMPVEFNVLKYRPEWKETAQRRYDLALADQASRRVN